MAWTAPRTWAVGELLTATLLNQQLRDNMKLLWRELSYTEFTSDVSVTATAEASPNDVVSAGAATYEAKPIRITFHAPSVVTGSTNGSQVFLNLWDGSTDLGRLATIGTGDGTQPVQSPVQVTRKFTPSAGSHTYKVVAWRATANGTVQAGAGGVGVRFPGFLRVEIAES